MERRNFWPCWHVQKILSHSTAPHDLCPYILSHTSFRLSLPPTIFPPSPLWWSLRPVGRRSGLSTPQCLTHWTLTSFKSLFITIDYRGKHLPWELKTALINKYNTKSWEGSLVLWKFLELPICGVRFCFSQPLLPKCSESGCVYCVHGWVMWSMAYVRDVLTGS